MNHDVEMPESEQNEDEIQKSEEEFPINFSTNNISTTTTTMLPNLPINSQLNNNTYLNNKFLTSNQLSYFDYLPMNYPQQTIISQAIPAVSQCNSTSSSSASSASSFSISSNFGNNNYFCNNVSLNNICKFESGKLSHQLTSMSKSINSTIEQALFNSPHNLVANGFLTPELLSKLFY